MKKLILLVLASIVLSGCAMFQDSVVRDATVMKYNYHEKRWSYEPFNSRLKYNYYEHRWEYAGYK
mgnify:CR=1 FL=1